MLTSLLCIFALGKLIAPEGAARQRVRKLLTGIAETWVAVNNRLLALNRGTRWDVELPAGLDRAGCYLVVCNHQSWVDILVLQRCFNRKLPLLRFFLKQQLIWVPFLGVAWWALDFPYMQRLSSAQRRAQPGRKGSDLEAARRACEKFREVPVAMMNFLEGTRFCPEKQAAQNSPYRKLLLPRIGGMGQVLFALGEQLDACIDVTIVYPSPDEAAPAPTFWDLVCGRIPRIVVRAARREIPADLRGRSFKADPGFRTELEAWAGEMWREKDALIAALEA